MKILKWIGIALGSLIALLIVVPLSRSVFDWTFRSKN